MSIAAKEIWIIFDPLNGPHIFTSKNRADRFYKNLEKEAEDSWDSFWEMSKPTKYVLANKEKQ